MRLIDIMWMQNADCPVGRHELRDHQWILLGRIKAEHEKIDLDDFKKRNKKDS